MERVLRILLVLVAAIFLLTAFNKCNAQTKLYEYCDIVGANITEKNKLTPYFTVYLDDGKQSLPKPMQNEQGQDIKFPTTMAAVNYMAKKRLGGCSDVSIRII